MIPKIKQPHEPKALFKLPLSYQSLIPPFELLLLISYCTNKQEGEKEPHTG